MDSDTRLAKVHDCLATGGFGAATVSRIVELVEHLDEQPDVHDLTALLREGGARS
jgi:hypothetical protein